MKDNKGLKIVVTIISVILSLGLSILSLLLGIRQIYWFYPFAAFFVIDAIVTLVGATKKDQYQGMLILGRWQVISVILVMVYLLAMILWDDPDKLMPYTAAYVILGIIIGIKSLFVVLLEIAIRKKYQPNLHALRNYSIIQAVFLLTMISLLITNQLSPLSGEGLLKEKPLVVYIIIVSINATSTIVVAFLALSTVVRANHREEVTTTGKIKYLAAWFNDNEISMFFSLIFSFYLIGLALMNMKVSLFYVFLAAYYGILAGIRVINYLWHRSILRRTNSKAKENRKSSWILLFNAAAYSIFSDVLAVGAILLLTDKINAGSNIYLFLFITIPFGILKLVLAIRAIKGHKEKNNTYRLGLGYIALINAMFSVLEIIAIAVHGIENVFKWIMVIASITVVKIFVLVIAVIFVVHFFRSMIINRRTREKKVS